MTERVDNLLFYKLSHKLKNNIHIKNYLQESNTVKYLCRTYRKKSNNKVCF